MLVAGAVVGTITGMDITIVGGHTTGTVIGSNTTPDIFPGRVRASGQVTVYLQDQTFLNYFVNETEVSIAAVLTATSAANSPFLSIFMPRAKCGAATADDGEKGLILTMPFTALRSTATVASTGIDDTTVAVQDSSYV